MWGVVLAAGGGSRFGGGKQFARAGGERLVDLAVHVTAEACDEVLLVLPDGSPWDGQPVSAVVAGGSSRTESVRNALAVVPHTAEIVVIHQAAHPLATCALFDAVLAEVRAGAAACVPGLRPHDPVRRVTDGVAGEDVGREGLVLLQTPGAFRAQVLRAAHAAGTDAIEDTALVTALGVPVSIVPGEPWNIHVTAPAELAMADCLLRCRLAT